MRYFSGRQQAPDGGSMGQAAFGAGSRCAWLDGNRPNAGFYADAGRSESAGCLRAQASHRRAIAYRLRASDARQRAARPLARVTASARFQLAMPFE